MNSLVNTMAHDCLRASFAYGIFCDMNIAEFLDQRMSSHYGDGKRISQAELSRQSGVPQPTISRVLKSKHEPELATLLPLLAALGVSVEEFWKLVDMGEIRFSLESSPSAKISHLPIRDSRRKSPEIRQRVGLG